MKSRKIEVLVFTKSDLEAYKLASALPDSVAMTRTVRSFAGFKSVLRNRSFDFVIIDMDFSHDFSKLGMIQTFRNLAQKSRTKIPFIYLSQHAPGVDEVAYLREWGVVDYLAKPLSKESIYKALALESTENESVDSTVAVPLYLQAV